MGGELDENVKVAVFGETLVDEFPDRSVLGGAPFNVAYHLKHLGLEPVPEGSVVLVILPASSYEYVVEFEFQSVTDVSRFALS